MTKLMDYVTYGTSPTTDVALQATDKHKAMTLADLEPILSITVTGILAIIARQYAQLGDETPEEYIGRLILKDQWERRDAEAWT